MPHTYLRSYLLTILRHTPPRWRRALRAALGMALPSPSVRRLCFCRFVTPTARPLLIAHWRPTGASLIAPLAWRLFSTVARARFLFLYAALNIVCRA